MTSSLSRTGHPDGPNRTAGSSGRLNPGLLGLGYLVFGIAGALCAAIEVLLVPSRWGQTLIPLAPALAVLSNVALPVISRSLSDTTLSAAPPVAGWLVATFVLASSTPEQDVLLPAGPESYISYSLLGLGSLAGLVTVGLAGRRGLRTRRPGSLRPGRAGSDNDGAQ
jgi:Family of unknown function (DUF6113)